jgi:hypothetical protein
MLRLVSVAQSVAAEAVEASWNRAINFGLARSTRASIDEGDEDESPPMEANLERLTWCRTVPQHSLMVGIHRRRQAQDSEDPVKLEWLVRRQWMAESGILGS